MSDAIRMVDVAKRAGVSPSTVSRALRNDPRIRESRRLEIQALAQEMGYRPNPLVSTLMMTRQRAEDTSGVTTIALVTDYGGDADWKTKDVCQWEFDGMMARANELGFRVEEFALREFGGSVSRVEGILKTRGIRGVVLGFSRDRSKKVLLNMDHFVVAGLSSYFREAQVDRANFHGFYNIRLALAEMRRLGYRRTGLVVPELNNRISGFQWSGAALDWQRNLKPSEQCRPFLPDGDRAWEAFHSWMKTQKPDSLLVYKLPVKSWLSKMGLRIPNEIGVAYLYRSEEEKKLGQGIDGNLKSVGAATVDLVVAGLSMNRFGVPEHPKEVLIKGSWLSGAEL